MLIYIIVPSIGVSICLIALCCTAYSSARQFENTIRAARAAGKPDAIAHIARSIRPGLYGAVVRFFLDRWLGDRWGVTKEVG